MATTAAQHPARQPVGDHSSSFSTPSPANSTSSTTITDAMDVISEQYQKVSIQPPTTTTQSSGLSRLLESGLSSRSSVNSKEVSVHPPFLCGLEETCGDSAQTNVTRRVCNYRRLRLFFSFFFFFFIYYNFYYGSFI